MLSNKLPQFVQTAENLLSAMMMSCKPQCCYRIQTSNLLHIIVVSTPRYLKKFTHNRYWILVTMSVDNHKLCSRPHFLSLDCRKSRSNLFSIRSRSSSFCVFCQGCCPSFLGRPFGFGSFPMAILRCSQLWRYDQARICL